MLSPKPSPDREGFFCFKFNQMRPISFNGSQANPQLIVRNGACADSGLTPCQERIAWT